MTEQSAGIWVEELEVRSGNGILLPKISFRLEPGDHAVITGASGSGKTTLLRVLAGLCTTYSGSAWYTSMRESGKERDAEPRTADGNKRSGVVRTAGGSDPGGRLAPAEFLRRGKISVLFQENRLLGELSSLENLRLVMSDRNRKTGDQGGFSGNKKTGSGEAERREILERLLPGVDPEKPVNQLSGGEARRVALARALIREAPVLLLDEPFTGLDEASVENVRRVILERGERKTVLVTDHEGEHFSDWPGIAVGLGKTSG